MALRIVEQAGRTDVGRQRTANEDSLVVRPPLFAVADGMGGAKAGEVASAVAVEAVESARESGRARRGAARGRSCATANRRIYDLAVADESRRGMGTTLTLAKVHGDEVSLAHVGDSRAYRMRDGELVAAHARPLAGRGARAQRADHGRGGGAPSAALDHHARARPRAGRGGGHLHAGRARRRRVPDLLGRPHVDDLRRRGRLDPALRGLARRGGRGARARRQPERRQGQHHGDPVPAGRGRGRRRGGRPMRPAPERRGHDRRRAPRRRPPGRGRRTAPERRRAGRDGHPPPRRARRPRRARPPRARRRRRRRGRRRAARRCSGWSLVAAVVGGLYALEPPGLLRRAPTTAGS